MCLYAKKIDATTSERQRDMVREQIERGQRVPALFTISCQAWRMWDSSASSLT
jgi:hypothetical protein